MSGRILITGASGFVGSALLGSLSRAGFDAQAANLDLLDGASVTSALSGPPVDVVVHLAAISHVPTCEKDPAQAYRVNLAGTALLLDALIQFQPQAHLIFASTAQVYAAPTAQEAASGVTFDENRSIAPQNTYARTKWECELLIQDAVERRGMSATILRLFNHSHKSQSPDFFLPHLYSVMSKGRSDQELVVPVGNLDVERDIGTAQDLMAAFLALLKMGRPVGKVCRVLNLCSGSAKNLRKVAQELADKLGLRVRFETDPTRVRAGEARLIVGSHRRFTELTGWTPACVTERDLVTRFLE